MGEEGPAADYWKSLQLPGATPSQERPLLMALLKNLQATAITPSANPVRDAVRSDPSLMAYLARMTEALRFAPVQYP